MPALGAMAGSAVTGNIGSAWVTVGANTSQLVSGMGAATTSMKTFGKAAMVLYAVVAAVKATTSAFIEFDRQLKNTWTLLDSSSKQMDATGNSVRTMARQYQTGAAEAQEALYHIVSATFYNADAMRILEEATKGAAAGLASLGSTGDMLTTVLNAYRMSASEATTISDYLFQTIRYGKCVTGDTRVLLSNGKYERIDGLENGAEVVSFDGERFVPKNAEWVYQGEKIVVKLTTQLGREIKTTFNHPYLTKDGWKKVMDLSVGDEIAVPTNIPYFGNVHVDKNKAAFLGLWIAESAPEAGCPRITTSLYKDKLEEVAKYFGCTINNVEKRPGKTPVYDFSNNYNGNKAMEFLRETGLDNCTTATKYVPDEVFSWDKESVAEFLHWYFNGDGWLNRGIDKGRGYNHQLGVCSKSEILIRQVSHLLLRFGIVGRVRKRRYSEKIIKSLVRENNNEFWVWECARNTDIRRFVKFIGIDREFAEEAANRPFAERRDHANCKISSDDVISIHELYAAGEHTATEISKMFGISQQYVSDIVRGKRRGESLVFPKSLDVKTHYRYDKIVEIEELHKEKVYDLVVPDLHNFVAEDIIAHNTTMSELAHQMGRLSGVAAPVGASFSDMSAAVATLTRQGIRTDWAITSLRQTLMQFIKPVKNLKMALKSLGYESGAVLIKQEGFAGALKLISKYAEENGIEMEQMFTNVRAITAVLPLATTAAGEYAKDLDRMAHSSGAATAAFEKQTQSWSYQIQKFTTMLNDFAISLGELLMPALKGVMVVIEGITTALRPVLALFKMLGGDLLLGVVSTAGAMAVAVWLSVKAWAALAATVSKAAAAMGIATAATVALTKAQQALALSTYTTGGLIPNVSMAFAGGATGAAGTVGFLASLKKSIGKIISKFGALKLLGAGLAGAFAVKQIMNIEVEPVIKMGQVQGGATARKALSDSLNNVLGGVAGGAVMGAMIGGPWGALAGGVTAGVGIIIRIVHEIRTTQAELDAPRIEELKSKFIAEFDFPEGIKGTIETVEDFLRSFDNVPDGALDAIVKELERFYDVEWDFLTPETHVLTKTASEFKKFFGDMSFIASAGMDEVLSSFESAWRSSKVLELTGGAATPTSSELMLMGEDASAFWTAARNLRTDTMDEANIGDILDFYAEQGAEVRAAIYGGLASEEIDTISVQRAIYEAINAYKGENNPAQARKALELAVKPLLDVLDADQILAFISEGFVGTAPGMIKTILDAAGKTIEEYLSFLESSATMPNVPQIEMAGISEGMFSLSLAATGLDPLVSKLGSEFYVLWKAMDEADLADKAAEWKKMSDLLDDWTERVEILAQADEITEAQANMLVLTIGKLGDAIGITNKETKSLVDSLNEIKLSNLLKGLNNLDTLMVDAVKESLSTRYIPSDISPTGTSNIDQSASAFSGIDQTVGAFSDSVFSFTGGIEKINQGIESFVETGIEGVESLNAGADLSGFVSAIQEAVGIATSLGTIIEGIGAWIDMGSLDKFTEEQQREILEHYETLKALKEKYDAAELARAKATADAIRRADLWGAIIEGMESVANALASAIMPEDSNYKGTASSVIGLGTTAASYALGLISGPVGWIAAAGTLIASVITDSANAMKKAKEKAMQTFSEIVSIGSDIFDGLKNAITTTISLFGDLSDGTQKLINGFASLFTQTEVYGRLQSALASAQSTIFNMLLGFLWPIVAVFEALFGVTTEVAEVIEKETEARMASLNVPSGYKVTRAEWEAATPGQPGMPTTTTDTPDIPDKPDSDLPEWVQEFIDQWGSAIDDAIEPLKRFGDALIEMWQVLMPGVMDALLESVHEFGTNMLGIAERIRTDLLPVLEDTLPNTISGLFDFFAGAIEGVAILFVDVLTNTMPSIEGFAIALGLLGDEFPRLAEQLAEGLSPAITSLIDGISTLINVLIGTEGFDWTNLFGDGFDWTNFFGDVDIDWEDMLSGISPFFDWLNENLSDIELTALDDIVRTVTGAFNLLAGAVEGIINFFVGLTLPNLDSIADLFDVLGDIGTLLPDLGLAIGLGLAPVMQTILEGALIPLAGWIRDTFIPDLEGLFGAFGSWWITNMDPWLQDDFFPRIAGWLETIYGYLDPIFEWLSGDVWDWFSGPVWDAIQPFVDSVLEMFEEFGEWVDENWDEISEFLTTVLAEKLGDLLSELDGFLETVKEWTTGGNPMANALSNLKDSFVLLWDVLKPLVGPIFYAAILLLTAGISILAGVVLGVLIAVVAVLNAVIWAWNNLIPFSTNIDYIDYPSLDVGGEILSSGIALVHKGEVVAPAGTAPLGNYSGGGKAIDNTIVLDGNVLYRGMRKVNQREQRRKTGSSIGGRAWNSA